MEMDEPVHQGLLLFPPQGVLGQLKKTWHKKYCQLFKASKNGIQRLEIWESKEDCLGQKSTPRIISLVGCTKIGPSSQLRVITVQTPSLIHHFGCITESANDAWTTALQEVAFPGRSKATIEVDNDLYCTSGEGIFSVKLIGTDAEKCNHLRDKNYTLLIADTEIKLVENDTILFTWPYRYIRKYGYGDGKFTFEAGRKCSSGEGLFSLEHNKPEEIFRCTSSKMESMKKFLRGEISPGMDLNDAEYHAALSMEAGSRSPLLSNSTQSSGNLIDLDHSTSSQHSQKTKPPSSASSNVDLFPSIKSPPPIVPIKPTKPPRKFCLPGMRDYRLHGEFLDLGSGVYRQLRSYTSPESNRNLSQTPEVVEEDEKHPYDLVEVRNNAWKTHGIDNIVHTERKDGVKKRTDNYTEFKDSRCYSDEEGGNEEVKNGGNEGGQSVEVSEEVEEEAGENLGDDGDSDCQYEMMISSSTGLSTTETIVVSPIIHNNVPIKSDSTANYDTLQHFGSLHKLNNNPGYKAPNLSLSLPMRNASSQCSSPSVSLDEANPSWNDYDIVEDVGSIRLADDSSRGYGVIRKKANAATNISAGPQHQIFNNSEYAIVSKPKRV